MQEQGIGITLCRHQVTSPLIGCQIIVETVEGCLTDTGLLGTTPPMADIMTAAQGCKWTYMIYIHLTAMTGHSLGHREEISTACAEEVIPKPHRCSQFGIIPGIATHVVSPGMALRVVSMHHVAIVPEAIPLILFDGLLIEIGIELQTLFHMLTSHLSSLTSNRQRPDTEGALLIEIFGCGQQTSLCRKSLRSLSHTGLPLIPCLRQKPQFTGTGNAIGCTHAFLHIFIAGTQSVSHRVVMTEIHRLGFRTPKPHRQLSLLTTYATDLYR